MTVADWTAASGFTTIEIACWPASSGDTRRYAGTSHIDVDGISDAEASEIVDRMNGIGLEISGLGYYPNPLHPDDEHARMVIDHLKKVIVAAGKMGVGVVNTFIGADRALTQDENWEKATRVWPEIISAAQDSGVKIAIENCPMIFSKDEWPSGHNLAYNPKIWRRMFEEFGETIGLNFDPSHLVWLMIDIESCHLGVRRAVLSLPGQRRDDRLRRALRERVAVVRDRMADSPVARVGGCRLGRGLPIPVSGRLRRAHHHRTRGPRLREDRRAGQARLPDRPGRAGSLRALTAECRARRGGDGRGRVRTF